MSDGIISVVEARALSISEQQFRYEVNLVSGVEDEVLDLSGKLETIRTALDDAEKRGLKEQSVKQWLNKLEDWAHEMEDILDEWHYALLRHKIANQKVLCCSFIPSPPSCLCFKKLGVRRNIRIKIRDAKASLDEILIEKDLFKFVTTSLPPVLDHVPKPLPRVQPTSSIELAEVHGVDIHRNKNELVTELMMDNGDCQLLSIAGMRGLGKTTLAQLIYNDPRVKDSFGLRIWIRVSHPFNVAGVAGGIAASVGRHSIPQGIIPLELVLEKLRDSISGKKFLLVLDDVWTEKYQEWEPLKINLGHGAAGSKILVTSRNIKVAKMMGSSDHQIYYPQHLSDDECWSLLRRISLYGKSEEECREFEDVGKKIASKCKGLPFAANVLGSLLQFKKSLEEWENVWKSEIWQLEKVEVDLFPLLLLSYNELSPTLKSCFSYCAVYPKDSEINAERLIQEWMALGYVVSVTGNGGVDMELKGRDYLNSLEMCSLLQDIKISGDGSIGSFKMHDIVRDFALFLRKNDGNLQSSCQVCSPLLVCRVQEYRSLVRDWNSPTHVCDCLTSVRVLRFERIVNGPPGGMNKLIHLRLLELSHNELLEEDLKIICRLYFLQTLLLSHCSLENIPIEIGNLVELRHLDLSYNEKLKELPGVVGNLVELRHLNLKRNFRLKELPESMCNLVELRFLDLDSCRNLKGLPERIDRLRNLQHLLIAETPASRRLPRGLGELSRLRTLETDFYVGSHCNKLGLLKKLTSLSGSLKLEINFTSGSASYLDLEELVEDAREAELMSKVHIDTLQILFVKNGEECPSSSPSSSLWMDIMEALEPSQEKLNKLGIGGYRGSRLPQWISSPFSLVTGISLFDLYELSSLPPLGRLPFLEFLSMSYMKELKFVGREFLGISSSSSSTKEEEEVVVAFPKLKWLSIECFLEWSEWEDITEEDEECSVIFIMPCLEELNISSCGSLKKLPHRLLRKASPSFRILRIVDSSVLLSQYGDKEGSGWRSISQNSPHLQLCLDW